jgi:hypothetical protein
MLSKTFCLVLVTDKLAIEAQAARVSSLREPLNCGRRPVLALLPNAVIDIS